MMTTLKSALERLSRGRSFKRRLPSSVGGGPLWITPEAGLRYWFKSVSQCDPALFSAAREFVRPGDIVWDVGANMGLFAFAAAGRAGSRGRVVAVEADTQMVDLLRRSAGLRHAGRAPVEVLSVAMSNTVGIAQFQIAARARAANSLQGFGTEQMGGVRESQSVVSVTLDWLLQHREPPRVVKIDVEGAETLVLQGATRLLCEARPLILCETHDPETVTQILKAHSYQLFDMDAPSSSRKLLQSASWNTIACPSERHDDFFAKP